MFRLWIGCMWMVCGLLRMDPALADEKGNMMPLETVQWVDIQRYIGLWHEIAKIPNRFQKQCVGQTTAHYTLRADGKIDVVNRCLKRNGKMDEARGIARVVDPVTHAKLQVSFVRFLGRPLFWGDYWIIGLDTEYRWVVVGTPTRRYGWILARERTLHPSVMAEIRDLLNRQGYNPDSFVPTSWESPYEDTP